MVQNRRLPSVIQTKDQDPHLLAPEQAVEQSAKQQAHADGRLPTCHAEGRFFLKSIFRCTHIFPGVERVFHYLAKVEGGVE